MPKVILQISYEIKDDKRDEYLELAAELRGHFAGELKKDYRIYEQRGKKNHFTEQFVCSSMDEYEALEDGMTERSAALVNRLESLIRDGKAKYITLIEI